jgi:transposase
MVYRYISDDLKTRLLYLTYTGYLPEEACALFGISRASYQRWKRNYRLYGRPGRLPLVPRGRPTRLSPAQRDELLALTAEAPDMYLQEVQEWMIVAQGTHLSISAICELLRDANQSRKRLRKAAAERDEEERDEWRVDVQSHLLADMCVCVDETSKDNRTIFRHYGRSTAGQRAVSHAPFKRGQRYSIVAALTVDGYIARRVVEGSVSGLEFIDFILQEVVRNIMTREPIYELTHLSSSQA